MKRRGQETETAEMPRKNMPNIERLRGFAARLRQHGTWSATHKVPCEKKERKFRKAMEEAAARLARADQVHKHAVEAWRSAHAELAEVLWCLWMEGMETDLGDVLARFADAVGDIRQMADVCQDFIRFFGDSSRWHSLYESCEDKEAHRWFPIKDFRFFRDQMDRAWRCLSEFTAADEVKTAHGALNSLLACWTPDLLRHGIPQDFLSLEYMRRWRDEFAHALAAMSNRLQDPGSFFVKMEEEPAVLTKEADVPSDRPASEAFVATQLREIVVEQADQLKRHVTRRVGQLRKPGDTKPGPTMSDERRDDLRRVHAYVQKGYSVNKACDMVDAENRERGASFAHYASAAAMRDAYPRWRAAK